MQNEGDKDLGATAGAVPIDQVQASTPAIAAIQSRLDNLVSGMLAKAQPEPNAEFTLRSGGRLSVHLSWKAKSHYGGFKFFRGTIEEAFAEAEAYVAALPTPEQARLTEFLESLDETIQLGKKADVDVEAINPLMEIMKRISKNALTHQAQPSASRGEAR